ncbi:MAG: hypothetical protein AAF447_12215 [Myxococcota bacterium]
MQRAVLGLAALLGCAGQSPAVTAPATTVAREPGVPAAQEPAPAGSEPPGTRTATPAEAELFAKLLRETESLRGLRFRRTVTLTVQTAEAIATTLTADLDAEDLEETRFVYVTLGLLAPDTDVRALLASVVADQVVGYYDTRRKRLVVREDVLGALREPGDGEAQMVLVHELVHALQDQHFGLPDEEDELDSDAANAVRSLAEGDATLAMVVRGALRAGGLAPDSAAPAVRRALMGQVAGRLGELETEALMATFAAPGQTALAEAPTILRTTLVMPYLYGLRFAARLARGTGDFATVDTAYGRRPGTTEQVMHPERYLAGEGADRLAFPPLPAFDAAGWREVTEDTLGELELGVFLGRGGAAPGRGGVDRSAAEGWSGDRLRVLRRGEAGAALWLTSWDDAREAQEAEAAARVAGAAAVRRGRGLLLMLGLSDDERRQARGVLEAVLDALPAQPPRGPGSGASPTPGAR